MRTLNALIVALSLAIPCVAAAETFQLWMEMFDETRDTTICKYRSGMGTDEVAEYPGRYLCKRVTCEVPPAERDARADNCAPPTTAPVT